MRPRSQSTTRMTIMVQSMDNPFGSVESLLLVLSKGYLPGKLFRPLSRAIVFRKEHERTQLKFRTPQSVTCRSDNEILAFFFARAKHDLGREFICKRFKLGDLLFDGCARRCGNSLQILSAIIRRTLRYSALPPCAGSGISQSMIHFAVTMSPRSGTSILAT